MVLTRKSNGSLGAQKNGTNGGYDGRFGLSGEDGERIRGIFRDEGLVCYRLHAEDGSHMQEIMDFIESEEGGNVTLIKRDDLLPLTETWITGGARGPGTGLDTKIVVSRTDEKFLAGNLAPETPPDDHFAAIKVALTGPEGENVLFELWKDQLVGTTGEAVDAVWGLEEVFSKGHYVARSAQATSHLVEEMKAQLGTDETVPVTLKRVKIGSQGTRDIMGIVLMVSDDAQGMRLRRQMMDEFDWTKLKERVGSEQDIALVDYETYLTHVAEAQREKPKVDEQTEVEVAERTAMFFRISEGVTQEQLLAKANEVLRELKYEEGDWIEDCFVSAAKQTGAPFARMVCKDRDVFRDIYFATSCFRDICGRSVRIVRGRAMSQRMAYQKRDETADKQAQAKQAWEASAGLTEEGVERLMKRLSAMVMEREAHIVAQMKRWLQERQADMIKQIVKGVAAEVGDMIQKTLDDRFEYEEEVLSRSQMPEPRMTVSQRAETPQPRVPKTVEAAGKLRSSSLRRKRDTDNNGEDTDQSGLKGARGENQVMDTDAMQGLANILMPMMREAMGGSGSAV